MDMLVLVPPDILLRHVREHQARIVEAGGRSALTRPDSRAGHRQALGRLSTRLRSLERRWRTRDTGLYQRAQ